MALQKLALAAGAIVVAVVLAEIAARLLVFIIDPDHQMLQRTALKAEAPWTVYNPELGWRNKPGADVPDLFSTGGVRINEQGFRADRIHAPKPPKERIRVLALGDSFTFGYAVGNGSDWPAQLERLDPRLEVINMGVAGYGLDQIVMLYEQVAPQYEHRFVVLGFLNWDLNRATNDHNATGYSRPLFRVRGGELVLTNVPVPKPKPPGSAIYGQLMLQRFWRTARINREMRRFIHQPEKSLSWRLGEHLLRRLDADARDHGAQLLVVDIPMFETLEHADDPMLAYAPRLFGRLDIPYIDLHPIFRAHPSPAALYATTHGGHCSPTGYGLIAERALELIQRQEKR